MKQKKTDKNLSKLAETVRTGKIPSPPKGETSPRQGRAGKLREIIYNLQHFCQHCGNFMKHIKFDCINCKKMIGTEKEILKHYVEKEKIGEPELPKESIKLGIRAGTKNNNILFHK